MSGQTKNETIMKNESNEFITDHYTGSAFNWEQKMMVDLNTNKAIGFENAREAESEVMLVNTLGELQPSVNRQMSYLEAANFFDTV